MADIVEEYRAHLEASRSPIGVRHGVLGVRRALAAGGSLDAVTADDLRKVLARSRGRDGGPIKPRSARNVAYEWDLFFAWAVDAGHLAVNPVAELRDELAYRPPMGTLPQYLVAHRAFMRRRELAPASIEKRIKSLWLLEQHAGRSLLEVDTATIEAFVDTRRNRAKDGPIDQRTRIDLLSHFHCFFSWAIAEEIATRDPTLRLVRPKMRRRLPRPIAETDYWRALQQAPNDRIRAWVLLAGHAGLRCAEIAGLRGENVAAGAMRVVGKGEKVRVVPMHPRLEDVARTWPAEGPVFVDELERAYEPARVSRILGEYLAGCGIAATAHQLRHRFATELLNESGDIALVGDILGHESLETTRIYAQVAQARKIAAVGRLA